MQTTDPRRYGKMQRTFQECMAATLSSRDVQAALLARVMEVEGLSVLEAFDRVLDVGEFPGKIMKLKGEYLVLFLDGDPDPNADTKWGSALDKALGLTSR